jgi:peptidyl-prolyl cis-trans isomerase C
MAKYNGILWLVLSVLWAWDGTSVQGFQSVARQHSTRPTTRSSLISKSPSHTTISRQRDQITRLCVLESIQGFFKRFTTKATASHILIKGGAEAENKLEDLKAEIGDSPVKFAEYAAQYSECPSASSGGNLGEFGPGAMVPEFDKVRYLHCLGDCHIMQLTFHLCNLLFQVVFNEKVGAVHGPIKTQFGYHLIYILERTE